MDAEGIFKKSCQRNTVSLFKGVLVMLEDLHNEHQIHFEKLKRNVEELNVVKENGKKIQEAIEKRVEQQTESVTDADKVLKFLEKNSKEMKYLFPFKVKVLSLPIVKNASQDIKNKIQKAKNMYSVIGIIGEVLSGE